MSKPRGLYTPVYIHQHNEESERNGWLIPAALGRAWLDAGGREQDRRAA